MHVRKGAWRYLLGVLALVAFTIALPLANSVTAPVAHAQGAQQVNTTTSPDSIARGGGLCNPTPTFDSSGEDFLSGGPTDPNCYVSATTDETGQTIDPVSFNPLGVQHTFIFTCGPATGADLNGTGATSVDFAPPSGCFDVQAKVDNESAGTAASIVNAKCGYNLATVTGSTANCNATQSPLCPTIEGAGVIDPGGDLPDNANSLNPPTTPNGNTTNQGNVTTSSGDLCGTADNTPPSGQQMTVTINPGAPNAYLITFTGYTLPCNGFVAGTDETTEGGTVRTSDTKAGIKVSHPIKTDGSTIRSADYFSPQDPVVGPSSAPYAGSKNVECASSAESTVPAGTVCSNSANTDVVCEPGVQCPTGMTYIPGGPDGFNISTSVVAPPFEGTIPIVEGVCQFTVAVEKKYVELTNITIGCYLNGSSTLTTTPKGTLLYSEGLKAFFGPLCTLSAVATGIVIIKTTDCNQEASLVGTTAPFPGVDSSHPAKYQCANNVLEVVGVVPDVPVPIKYTVTGPGGLSNVIPGPTLSTSSGDLCAASSENTSSTATGMTQPSSLTTYLCPTGPGTGTVQACFASSIDTQGAGCSNFINFTWTLPNGQRVVPYVRWAGEKQLLTKCFGGEGLMAGAPVEFTLAQGNGATAGAALIPASIPSDVSGTGTGTTGGGTAVQASQDTVWTITDQDGCASVIVFASGEGQVVVDASIFSVSPISGLPGTTGQGSCSGTACGAAPLINEHAFEIFYLKFDHLDIENIVKNQQPVASLNGLLNFGTAAPPGYVNPGTGANFNKIQDGASPAFPDCAAGNFCLPNPPGTNPQPAGGYSVALCNVDYVRAMVHGYFEMPGDPSGRPATNVTLTGSPTGAAGSYVLPAGRWVLPEDWPVLATFAGFNAGSPNDITPNSVMSWDLNSGWVFNQAGEKPVLCMGIEVGTFNSTSGVVNPPAANTSGISSSGAVLAGGAIPNGDTDEYPGQVAYGPCYGTDANSQTYSTGGSGVGSSSAYTNYCSDGSNNLDGVTAGIGPFDITQQCTDSSGPMIYKPAGNTVLGSHAPGPNGETEFSLEQLSGNSTYLPNGTLNQWDAPMPAAQVSFSVTGGAGFLNQVNKSGLYGIPTVGGISALYPDPFYATAIPPSPAIPPFSNNGGYWWNTWGFTGGGAVGTTTDEAFVAGESTTYGGSPSTFCPNGTFPSGGGGGPTTNVCYLSYGGSGADTNIPQPVCQAVFGTFVLVTAGDPPRGQCYVSDYRSAQDSTAGGLNLSSFGQCPAGLISTYAGSTNKVIVADGTGFVAGQTVGVYSSFNGAHITGNLVLTNVAPATSTTEGTGYSTAYSSPNAAILTFAQSSIPNGLCILAGHGVFFSEQTALPLSAADITSGSLAAGTEIDLTESSGPSGSVFTTSTSIADFTGSVSTSGCPAGVSTATGSTGCIWVNGSEALARALGGCIMSRGALSGPTTFGACEPGDDYLAVGTLVQVGPQQGEIPPGRFESDCTLFPTQDCATGNGSETLVSGAQGPYPFWQWVPNTPTATSAARSATVYSDNHGESVVSLETGIVSSLLPSSSITTNGGCPYGYSPVPSATAATSCLLNIGSLGNPTVPASGGACPPGYTINSAGTVCTLAFTPGGTPFPGLSAAQSTFSKTNPGCGTYSATTNTFTAAPSATPLPNGAPAAGLICVNGLGGVDLGQGAVLGSTNVQAVADYPYFKLHPAISSGAITKVFASQFAKDVKVTPGTPCNPSTATSGCGIAGPAGTTTFNVTITAQDICGNPIVGEPVDIFALGNAGAVVLAPGTSSTTSTSTSTAIGITDATGTVTATLEVLNTAIGTQGLVIKVVFPRESLERFATVIPGTLPNQTFTALYGAGYNQVGGPPGSNFSSAEVVYLYNTSSGGYTQVSSTPGTNSTNNLSSAAPSCTGYWAYFASITAVSLPATSTSGQTAACSLAAGWNLVGNPFATPAVLPSSVTAYHYDPTTASYSVVGAIPPGGSVWIFETAAATVTLTAT